MKRWGVGISWLVLVAVGCAAGGGGTVLAAHPPPAVTDYAGLMEMFRAAGFGPEPGEEVDQPFLAVTGRMIRILGGDVQVFQYSDAEAAEAQAALVSPDGTTVGTTQVQWVEPPHFYKQGKVLILYTGDDARVLKALETVLGRQFAGQ